MWVGRHGAGKEGQLDSRAEAILSFLSWPRQEQMVSGSEENLKITPYTTNSSTRKL